MALDDLGEFRIAGGLREAIQTEDLRGTKPDARKENTSSPRWLVPVVRACMMPHSGREPEALSDSTSLA